MLWRILYKVKIGTLRGELVISGLVGSVDLLQRK